MMKIAMIAAMAQGRVIGKANEMPWHMPADLAHFKRITLGKPVIMGRNTYESIGKALPGRLNIVITANTDYTLRDAEVVHSVEAALQRAYSTGTDEVMIIGGGMIYQHLLSRAQRLYLTFIDTQVDGDTYFPDYQSQGSWQEIDRQEHQADERNQYGYSFVTLERVDGTTGA